MTLSRPVVGGSAPSDRHLRSDVRFIAILSCTFYLVLPFPIFFWGWYKPAVAVPLIAGLVLIAWWAVRQLTTSWLAEAPEPDRLAPRSYLLLLLGATALLALTGTGGIFHQTSDWITKNAMIGLLMSEPWPPTIETEVQTFQLSYYVTWYLPAALVGRAAGWAAAQLVLLPYTAFGLAALLLLSSRLTGAKLPVVFAVFVAFAGLDAFGEAIMSVLTGVSEADFPQEGDWWAAAFRYSGNITLLNYVPNQAIGGWLVTALLVAGIQRGKPLQLLFFCVPISMLWTPWVTFGILPIGLYFSIKQLIGSGIKDALFSKMHPGIDVASFVSGVAISIALVTYFSTRLTVTEADFAVFERGYLDLSPGVTYFTGTKWITVYVLFILIEIAGMALLLWWALRDLKDRRYKEMLAVSLLALLIIPLFRYGYFNDLVMRVSIPSLFILMLIAALCVSRSTVPIKRYALSGFLMLCFFNAAWVNWYDFRRNFAANSNALMILKADQIPTPLCMHEVRVAYLRQNWLRQYVGKPDWAIHKLLLRPPGEALGPGRSGSTSTGGGATAECG